MNLLAVFVAWLVALAGCGPREVVVADLPPSAGGAFLPQRPCSSSAECPPDAFCQKPTCEAPAGRCEHRPVFCPAAPAPTCGCDGVTYWNDCLRAESGAAASIVGECSQGASCNGTQQCPVAGASCGRMLPATAACPAQPVPGTCWVLPPVCPPPAASDDAWRSCGASACGGACETLRAGVPAVRVVSCP